MKTRHCFVWLMLFLANLTAFAASDNVTLEISDGIPDKALSNKIAAQASKLLTAINTADSRNDFINYTGINISSLASGSLGMIWNNVHFRTEDDDLVVNGLVVKENGRITGYQVRSIDVEMKPLNNTFDGEAVQELCIDFSPQGEITDVNFTMGLHNYSKIMKEAKSVEDTERRLQIISWCEKFKNAYGQKDKKFMDAVFSDDALIITGKVVKERVKNEVGMKSTVTYSKMGKEQYLKNLFSMFDRPGYYINVEFEDYEVRRHGANPNIYGVTLRQKWHSSTYHDEGIVFLIWDFSDENNPKIHVRTWQPLDQEPFSLGDFKNLGMKQ